MYASAIAAPRFKSSLEAIVVPEEGLYLFSHKGHVCLTSPIFSDLAPLLDGSFLVDDIFDQLCRRYLSADIFSALDILKQRGFLAEDTAPIPREQQAFWECAGALPSQAVERLANATVDVICDDGTAEDLRMLLERNGLCVADRGELSVVVADDYLNRDLAEWNKKAVAEQRPWILVSPGGMESWLGPAFVPGETACLECLTQRLRWHRRVDTHIGRLNGLDKARLAPQGSLAASKFAALAEIATEVARWIGTGRPEMLADRVISTDHLSMQRKAHVLTRRPQCPVCGDPAQTQTAPDRPVLRSRPKLQGTDGGHRSRRPADIQAALDRHVSPITGIVGALEPGIRSGPDGSPEWITPTYSADHNFSDLHDSKFFLREGLRRRSGGKGRNPKQARISAIAESLERYCGVFDGSEPRHLARYRDLDRAIPPNACQGYSAQQFADRAELNRKTHKAYWVPEPFDPEAQIEWTPLWSLGEARIRHLPTSMCYFGYRGPGPSFGRADSNGCAAGGTLEEAILQGLLELIERDAVAIWWYNRLNRPGVDLAAARDSYGRDLSAHYAQLHRTLTVIDVTSDISIPTFAAISARTDKQEEDIIYGFGCHLDPEVALSRALTEINQSLEAVPKTCGATMQQSYLGNSDAIDWWRTTRLHEARYLVPDETQPMLALDSTHSLAADDVLEDIQTCLSRLKAKNIDVLVLDQTRPDVNFPVVRVVAPGLRHFWARFGPGRLYDVPVEQGWLAERTQENDLNPHVIQF